MKEKTMTLVRLTGLLTLPILILSSVVNAVVVDDIQPVREADGINWYDIRDLGVEGQGWTKTKASFDRLPARAEGNVRDAVWSLSRHSAGMCVRFRSAATEFHAHWKLTSSRLAMPHMPATGVSGLDLYVLHDGKWRWLVNGRPQAQETKSRLVTGLPPGTRDYLLYLPLYNGVTQVEIGVPMSSTIMRVPAADDTAKPIVFYGTSITHGACASRPGMVHTAILGRWLNAPVINLGFSGNGRMEPEVAELIAEIDASVYVLDCLPNITAADVTARTAEVVAILRAKHPSTPIVLVEDRSYADSFLVTSKRKRNESSRVALRAEFEKLKAAGDQNLYYIYGENLLGNDGEGTVDSSHPSDLGFMRQATAFREIIEPLMQESP
jgi:GDSL-like Lipase/Acylhydrolase family/N-terminus of Esterase_SGNH_hydro-type